MPVNDDLDDFRPFGMARRAGCRLNVGGHWKNLVRAPIKASEIAAFSAEKPGFVRHSQCLGRSGFRYDLCRPGWARSRIAPPGRERLPVIPELPSVGPTVGFRLPHSSLA